MRTLEVALPLPLPPLTYLPPLGREEEEALGRRVAVPFRKEVRVGVVVGEGEAGGLGLRHAIGFLDPGPYLRPEEIRFLKEAAQLLFAPLGQLLLDLLPPWPPLRHRVRLFPGAQGPEALRGWREAAELDPELLEGLREGGVLEEEVAFRPKGWVLFPLKPHPDPGVQEALEALARMGGASSRAALARALGVSEAKAKRLIEEGYLGPRPPLPQASPGERGPLPPLPLPEGAGRVHGGRPLERLRALAGLLGEGDHLVLFPEVGLLERFLPFFPGARPYHGGLKEAEREGLFRAPQGVVFATYGGLLLPFTPRRIVVVEEGSESYKLPGGSRAHTPLLAELRARLLGVPLTHLGQVPGVEVLDQKGLLLPPPRPRALFLDLRQEKGFPLVGRAWALLHQVAEKDRQALVLASRKGYSALLLCPECGHKPTCPNCALPLRFHRQGGAGLLLCHQCGHLEPAPPLCPRCDSPLLKPKGPGVDWLYEELRKGLALPVYRRTGDGGDDLTPLREGRPGVVVGTTALLRGPVLPELALVLVPYAEGFLWEADFRAEERYHRLLWALTELRPGRRPLLAVQTYTPDHPVHQALAQGDLEAFPRLDLARRRALGYPPCARMVKLEVRHPKEERARERAFALLEALKGVAGPGEVLGPAPAPVPRLKGYYLYHLLLKGSTERLAQLLDHLFRVHPQRDYRLDPDPVRFVGLLED